MKICPNCNAQLNDNDAFCQSCGAQMAPNQAPNQQYQPPVQPMVDPFDHTAEFDAKDISDNKVFCMLIYLMGIIGVIIALIASNKSDYVAFHVRQGLKFTVVEILVWIIAALTFWLFFLPIIAAVIISGILAVVKIICFFQICYGQAKEPYILRGLKFLK